MSPPSRALLGAVAVLFAAAALGGWALAPQPRLALLDEQGQVLLHADGPVTIRYRHSVTLTPVEEDFVLVPGGVRVTTTRFSTFGAGMPTQPEWGGTFSAPAGPGEPFSVGGMDATFPAVTFRVGYVSEQTLLLEERAVRFDSLVPPGSTVTLRAVSRPRYQWWELQP